MRNCCAVYMRNAYMYEFNTLQFKHKYLRSQWCEGPKGSDTEGQSMLLLSAIVNYSAVALACNIVPSMTTDQWYSSGPQTRASELSRWCALQIYLLTSVLVLLLSAALNPQIITIISEAAKTLIHAFISSRLDNWKSLLYGDGYI